MPAAESLCVTECAGILETPSLTDYTAGHAQLTVQHDVNTVPTISDKLVYE